ncbi:hypothetical protein D3C72_2209690 [compost metagenome]
MQERTGGRADIVQHFDDLRLLGCHGIDDDLVHLRREADVAGGILSDHLEYILTIGQRRIDPGKTPDTLGVGDGCAELHITVVNGDQAAGFGLARQHWRVVGGVAAIGDS